MNPLPTTGLAQDDLKSRISQLQQESPCSKWLGILEELEDQRQNEQAFVQCSVDLLRCSGLEGENRHLREQIAELAAWAAVDSSSLQQRAEAAVAEATNLVQETPFQVNHPTAHSSSSCVGGSVPRRMQVCESSSQLKAQT